MDDSVKFLTAAIVDGTGTPTEDRLAGDAVVTAGDAFDLSIAAGSGEDSVDGASNETVVGSGDTLSGLAGNDTIAGDVYGDGAGPIALAVTAGAGGVTHFDYDTGDEGPDAGSGGANNHAAGFADSLLGGLGADALVGDVISFSKDEAELVADAGGGGLSGSYRASPDAAAGGDDNSAHAFNDTLRGGDGSDLIVGDLWKINGNSTIEVSAGSGYRGFVRPDSYGGSLETPGEPGSSNQTIALADLLVGAAGNDTQVGDAFSQGRGDLGIRVLAGAGRSKWAGGDDNEVAAAADTAIGGSGDDVLVGDAYRLDALGDSVVLQADAGEASRGSYQFFFTPPDGGSGNRVTAFADSLTGNAGNDTIAGDVLSDHDLSPLSMNAFIGRAGTGLGNGAGGDENMLAAFADSMRGGGGDDWLAGDLLRLGSEGDVALFVAAGSGSVGGFGGRGSRSPGKAGGDDGAVHAFNDLVLGGDGNDQIVGDIAQHLSRSELVLSVDVGVAGNGRGSVVSYVLPGGDGGSGNSVDSFDDNLRGGNGDDVIVGDVHEVDSEGNLALTVRVGAGGNGGIDYYGTAVSGGAGGEGNHVAALCDMLDGGDGNDWLAGDVGAENSSAHVTCEIDVGTGGDGSSAPAGAGGDGNLVDVSNDRLTGGAGDDTLIGDIARDDLSIEHGLSLTIRIDAGSDGSAETPGGTGNAVVAFCDTLIGGNGDDLLCGDYLGGYYAEFDLRGDGGNTMSAFRDDLQGGSGNDTLLGETINDDYSSFSMIHGSFGGRALLFADTLSGGAGDDSIVGGLGADSMTGGAGSDRFSWTPADLTIGSFDPGSTGGQRFAVVDTITDFSLADVLDLSAFHSTVFDAADVQLRVENGDTVVSVNPQAGFVDLVVLHDFTTMLTVQQLVDDGVILIA
ncbi:MAG: hypothetical protein IPK66_11625 [Rhodospirillales bacterium]|nr:hypothetical protein [Rhodospirillales bacterium]